VLRISLEVSSVTGSVTNGQGSTAYQVGTRQASSVIRLHDGETQVLAGLIRDDETRSIAGLPGLLNLPLLGRLFGTRTDEVSKKELVLFITPRVIRNVVLPDAVTVNGPAGMELNPGANSLQIQSRGGMQTAVPRDNNRGGGFGGSGSYPGFPTAPAPSSPTTSPFDPPVAPAVPLSPQIRLPPPVGAEATQARP
jgi:general secretion pathway protein D